MSNILTWLLHDAVAGTACLQRVPAIIPSLCMQSTRLSSALMCGYLQKMRTIGDNAFIEGLTATWRSLLMHERFQVRRLKFEK